MKTGRIMRALAARAASGRRAAIGEHPEPDVLLGYSRGETAGDAKEEIQEHISMCPDCARAILDFRKFPGLAAPGGKELSDREIDAEWLRLLGRTRRPEGGRPAPDRATQKTEAYSWRLAYGLAACFLLASLGLTAWNLDLRGRIADLSQPRVNVFVAEAPPPDTRGAEDGVAIGGDVKYVRFELAAADLDEYDSYRVVITDDEGRETFSNSDIQRNPAGDFTLEIAVWQLPPTSGAVAVFGVAPDRETELARIGFTREQPQ